MEFLKFSLLICLFLCIHKSRQEDNFFIKVGKKINKDFILLTCNVTFTNKEFVHRIEWYKEGEIWSVNNLQYLYSESKKKIQVSSFVNITRDIVIKDDLSRDIDYNNIGEYACHIYTTVEETPAKYRWENFTKKIHTPAKFVQKNYINVINLRMKDFEHLSKVLPTIGMAEKYIANYWITYYMEQEGNQVFIPCIFNKNKFQMNKNW